MQVEKLRSLIRESINEYIREIDQTANEASQQAKVNACEEAIKVRKERLNRISENEDLKEMVDETKVKEIQNEIKALENYSKKANKILEKMRAKKDKKEKVVTDAKTEDAPVDEADVTAQMEMSDDGMKEEALNESFLKMQKLAGVITEAQYNSKKKALVENQTNEIFGFGKDYSKDPGVIYAKKWIDGWVNDKQLTPDEGKKLLSKMTEWVKQYEKNTHIPNFFTTYPPDEKNSAAGDDIYLAMKDFIKKIAPNSKLNKSYPSIEWDQGGHNYVER